MAKASSAAAAQAAAIRASKSATSAAAPAPPRYYTQQDIDRLKEAGRLPRIQVGAGRFATYRDVKVGDPFKLSPTQSGAPNSIRQGGEDIPIFEPIPQTVGNPAGYSRGGTPPRGANEALQGGGPPKFRDAMAELTRSENFLEVTNLTGKKRDPSTYVTGTQARISALRSARSQLQGFAGPGGTGTAAKTVLGSIEKNLKLAMNQRNAVQNVLGEFRAKQRAAQRVNAEVQSGRRPRRSGAAVIPNLPGLLGPTRKY